MKKYSVAIVALKSPSSGNLNFIRKSIRQTLQTADGLKDKKLIISSVEVAQSGYHIRIKNEIFKRLKQIDPTITIFFDPDSDTNIAWATKQFAQNTASQGKIVFYFGYRSGYDRTLFDGHDNLLQTNHTPLSPFCDLVTAAILSTNN